MKEADFIYTLKKKQEVWHKMMTISATPQQYYNPVLKSSLFRLPLSSQFEAFFCFQTQQRVPPSQKPWRVPDQASDLTQPTPVSGFQCQYSAPSF